MKILYIAPKYDYGKPERGFSFEHYNFYDSLVKMNGGEHEVGYFALDEVMHAVGRDAMNAKLLERVEEEKPDICFFSLFAEEIKKETIRTITETSGAKTFNWFSDDHWRFDSFSKYYAPCFHFVSTTDSQAIEKYHAIGYPNVIKTQWACNHFLYAPAFDAKGNLPGAYEYDLTFIGQPHGNRKKIIAAIENSGVAKPACFGFGWPKGKVSQERMIELFQKSRINLNLTKASMDWTMKGIGHIFFKRRASSIVLQHPRDIALNIKMFFSGKREQIKGRNFEVPGSGGFILTGPADNIGDYYALGKEIVVYRDTADLIGKIDYYLKHPEEREAIKKAGYERTIREHTYEKRFNAIFAIVTKVARM